jgi:hypothetical protein
MLLASLRPLILFMHWLVGLPLLQDSATERPELCEGLDGSLVLRLLCGILRPCPLVGSTSGAVLDAEHAQETSSRETSSRETSLDIGSVANGAEGQLIPAGTKRRKVLSIRAGRKSNRWSGEDVLVKNVSYRGNSLTAVLCTDTNSRSTRPTRSAQD